MLHLCLQFLCTLLFSLVRVHAYDVVECYWAEDEQLPTGRGVTSDTYIPCGDVSQGAQSCCRVGHNCLEASACYAPEAGMVYTAGCTDSSYADSSCPSKCGISSYWIGHSYCNGTSNEWTCCSDKYGGPDNEVSYPFNNKEPCWCPEDDAMIAFSAPSVIPSVAYLDLSHPGSISYFAGHSPSTAEDDSSITTSNAASSSTTATSDAASSTTGATTTADKAESTSDFSTDINSPASNTASTSSADSASNTQLPGSAASPSSSSAPSPNPGLSTGTKTGIGVGVGVGGLALLALLWLLLRYLRKRRRTTPAPIEDQIRPKSITSYAATSPESANGDLRSPAWSGHKSELPADASTVVSPTIPSTNSMAEVEGTTSRQKVQSQFQSQPPRQSGLSQQPAYDANGVKQYVPYNPASNGQNMHSIHEMPG